MSRIGRAPLDPREPTAPRRPVHIVVVGGAMVGVALVGAVLCMGYGTYRLGKDGYRRGGVHCGIGVSVASSMTKQLSPV